MTYTEVVNLINQWIVTNGNREITASVLNPILQAILNWSKDSVGDLDTLNTTDQSNLVNAINEVNTALSNINVDSSQVYYGTADPNDTPPPDFTAGDFYLQQTIDNNPVALFLYQGFVWVDLSSIGVVPNFQTVTDEGATTTNVVTFGDSGTGFYTEIEAQGSTSYDNDNDLIAQYTSAGFSTVNTSNNKGVSANTEELKMQTSGSGAVSIKSDNVVLNYTAQFPEKAESSTQTIAMLSDIDGGAVDSVNGQTGVVVLDAADVGAPSGSGTSTGTNTGDQDLSGLVAKSAYTPAHSILVQQSGTGSPTSLQISNNTLVGRLSGGGSDINDLSVSQVKTLLDFTTPTDVQTIADAKVTDAIVDGVTTVAPSQNVVFDALALKENITTATTGAVISFATPQVYNSIASPSSSNITYDLTGARIGVVQKIYHNAGTAPTFPAGSVLRGTGSYVTSTLNIIYLEWSVGTTVEYWITQ
jgi:hypothetical protein